MLTDFRGNVGRFKVPAFQLDDGREGIVHVVGPEQGFTLPGVTLVCGDSHTSTHGALGALAFGIGVERDGARARDADASGRRRPKTMRIASTAGCAPASTAKDVILAIIARIGADGAVGHVIEYAGCAIARDVDRGAAARCATCRSRPARAPAWSRPTRPRSPTSRAARYAPQGAALGRGARVLEDAADAMPTPSSIAKSSLDATRSRRW